jgi:plastocyanin
MRKRLLKPAGVLIATAVLGLPACSLFESQSDGGAVPDPTLSTEPSEPGKVLVRGTSFNPEDVTATVGMEVVWTFDDGGLSHSVTADDGTFDSGKLPTGEFRHAFAAAGKYAYHCEVHTRMRGNVTVS